MFIRMKVKLTDDLIQRRNYFTQLQALEKNRRYPLR